ncbi:MAG TPA: hypothetical protein VJT81_06720 [Burkholderiales bacterium]|nr:hypothetical protein [Burkholderiales bacterium]
MIFYLQRQRPFIGRHPQDWYSPLKKFLRDRLERLAVRIATEQGPPQYPKFIDSELHKGNELIDQVEADCWIVAKQRLGYPLATNQVSKMLAQQTRRVIEFRRRVA